MKTAQHVKQTNKKKPTMNSQTFEISCVSQLNHHVDTTAVMTWEAAPAEALVNTMATVVMTTPVSSPESTTEKPVLSLIINVTLFCEDGLQTENWGMFPKTEEQM